MSIASAIHYCVIIVIFKREVSSLKFDIRISSVGYDITETHKNIYKECQNAKEVQIWLKSNYLKLFW